MDGARTVTATYGSYDETGLSSQVSMKLVYRVEDEVERVFRCAARNPLTGEELFSQEATVTAEMPKDVTEMTPMSPLIVGFSTPEVVAMETQRLALPCQVVGYPQPYVLWRKDGEFVDDSRVYIMADHTLIIPDCSPPDSVPPATVTWYKDYAPFVQRTGQFAATIVRGSGESWDLYFSSVQESDEGDYYCVASNNYSTPNSRTSKVAQLTVYGAPVITDPPINTEILKGTLLHMSCQVDLRTVRDQGQNLWISDVGKSWEGQYTCVAENSYGQKTASASVTVIEPPRPPELLEARPLSKNSVLLRWQHVFQAPETTVDTFSITYRQRVGGRTVMYPEKLSSLITQWEVDGLKPGTESFGATECESGVD
nr:hypothetical protein BaRGS_011425 [Batillaria attramentaria]